jgi:hypothetical protein
MFRFECECAELTQFDVKLQHHELHDVSARIKPAVVMICKFDSVVQHFDIPACVLPADVDDVQAVRIAEVRRRILRIEPGIDPGSECEGSRVVAASRQQQRGAMTVRAMMIFLMVSVSFAGFARAFGPALVAHFVRHFMFIDLVDFPDHPVRVRCVSAPTRDRRKSAR